MKSHRKNRGFIFAELLLTAGLFTGIIFPLIMLMNKNIERISDFRKENEARRITENLENIFLTLSNSQSDNLKIKEQGKIIEIEGSYFLIPVGEGVFVLKNENGAEITKLRNIKYFLSENSHVSENKIKIVKKSVYFEENSMQKEITEIYILYIDFKNKKIRKILK